MVAQRELMMTGLPKPPLGAAIMAADNTKKKRGAPFILADRRAPIRRFIRKPSGRRGWRTA